MVSMPHFSDGSPQQSDASEGISCESKIKIRMNSGELRVARGGSRAKAPPLAARPNSQRMHTDASRSNHEAQYLNYVRMAGKIHLSQKTIGMCVYTRMTPSFFFVSNVNRPYANARLTI